MNLVNLTLTVAVVSGAYLGWLWIPLWLDDLDVREALAAGVGQLTSENLGVDAAMIQKNVATRLARVGYHWEEQDGKQVQVPGIGVEPDDVQIERGADGRFWPAHGGLWAHREAQAAGALLDAEVPHDAGGEPRP